MDALFELANKVKNLDINDILVEIYLDPAFERAVILFNTVDQLFEGIDSEGISLESIGGEYTDFTKIIKKGNQQPIDRVTLLDTGAFYLTFGITVQGDGFTIIANTKKGFEDLEDRWGENIIGLTDENLQNIINAITPEIQKKILQRL